MRNYIIALNVTLPDIERPEDWLRKNMGSVVLKEVEIHIEEIGDNESKTKRGSKTRSTGVSKENSDKTQS